MCCVAIARRKSLRCNISAFPKYEVGSCITGQRSEKQNALAGTNHMCPCATEDVLFLPLPLCPRLKEAEPQGRSLQRLPERHAFFFAGSVIASSTCCRNAFDAFDMSTLLREHLVSQKCEHTRPVTATSELLFQLSDTQSA